MLVDRKKESLIPFIERKAGLKFERIGAPQPQDVARIAANRAVEAIRVRCFCFLQRNSRKKDIELLLMFQGSNISDELHY